MPTAKRADIELHYEVHGKADGPPLLLIPGLAMQSIDWPEYFVDALGADHQLILYDNRDRGLSTVMHGAPSDAAALMAALMSGESPELAYTLSDMAADGAAVLDAVGADRAHAVGISMGAMIAQTLAIEQGERLLSLTSIMGTTGAPDVGQPSPEAIAALMTPPADSSRQAHIATGVENCRIWSSPSWYDADEMTKVFGRSWDRVGGAQVEGTARQLCAILASPARDEALRGVDTPTVVIHGTADKLVDPSGGRRTAECIPGAELVLFDGMGHDIPRQTTAEMAQAISGLVRRTS